LVWAWAPDREPGEITAYSTPCLLNSSTMARACAVLGLGWVIASLR
jgi:hypothetical protein